MRIAVVGGTGREGRGLAVRWAKAGHEVTIGSREADKARERRELAEQPEMELEELTNIYIGRGVSPDLARQVA